MRTLGIDDLICKICKLLKPLNKFVKNRRMKRGFGTICKSCNNEKVKNFYKGDEEIALAKHKHALVAAKWIEDLKFEVISHYGSCYCCGENRIEFLTLDHIDGGGSVHRKEVNHTGSRYYVWVRNNNYPEGLRTACMNCNMGTRFNKVCPHKMEDI